MTTFFNNYKNFRILHSLSFPCLPPRYEFFIITFSRNVSSLTEKIFIFTSYYRRRLLLQDRMLQVLRAIHRSRRQDVRPAPPLGLTILVQNHCFRQILKIWKNWNHSNDYFIVKKKNKKQSYSLLLRDQRSKITVITLILQPCTLA